MAALEIDPIAERPNRPGWPWCQLLELPSKRFFAKYGATCWCRLSFQIRLDLFTFPLSDFPITNPASPHSMHVRSEITRAIIRSPMVRVAVPFVLGLVAGRAWWLPVGAGWLVVAIAAVLWAWLSFRKQVYGGRWLPGMALMLLLFLFGVQWQGLRDDRRQPDHVSKLADGAAGWLVQVQEVASERERYTRAWVEVHAALLHGKARPARGLLLATFMTDSLHPPLRMGDRLLVETQVEPIAEVPDPGGFDVRAWAAGRGAYHECFAPAERWKRITAGGSGMAFFEHARQRITQWLQACGLPDRERALVKAVLLGLRDELEPDQNQAFVQSGTVHVLAVSGSHVGIIYVALWWGLASLARKRWGRVLRGVLTLVCLWAYAGLTGATPSVLRATLMFSLFTIAGLTRWRAEPLNSLACAAFLLLLWDPSMLGQLGFQLSFLAVLGIIAFYRPLYALWMPRTLVGRFFWSLLAVSLVAQAFTLPLCLYVFHAFPVWFLPANMAIVGLVGLAVYGGVLLLLFHAVPVLGAFLSAAMAWLLMLLGWLSEFFAQLPMAYPAVRIGFWGMLGLYVLIVALAVWGMERKRWARTLSFASVAALLLGWGWTAHRRNAQQQFVVYNERNGLTCAFVQGRSMRVFSDSISARAEKTVLDHVRIMGVKRVQREPGIPESVNAPTGAVRFMRLGKGSDPVASMDSASTLVLYGEGWLDRDDPLPVRPSQLVLAPNLYGALRRRLVDWAGTNDVPVFDVRGDGAYVRP
jgi:competence protein ComEC